MTNENLPTDLIGGEGAVNASMAAVGAADGSGAKRPLKDFFVDMTADVVMPEYRLKIGGVGVLPKGGICVVTGAAKQGKTQFLNAMGAVLCGGHSFGSMCKGVGLTRKVLLIDTEQSLFEIQNNMNRLYRLAGIKEKTHGIMAGIPCYSLRPLMPDERIEKINEAIAQHEPDVLIIDGIRDLLNDFNDPTESNAVVSWLLQLLTDRPDMSIVTVIHTNPGTEKMRGHLGTELMNKCADKFTCEKKNGSFSVTHTSRQMEMQGAFTFRIENGDLTPCGADVAAGVVDPEQTFVAAISPDGSTWSEIVHKYKRLTGCTKREAEAVFREKCADGVIVQPEKPGKWYLPEDAPGYMAMFDRLTEKAGVPSKHH